MVTRDFSVPYGARGLRHRAQQVVALEPVDDLGLPHWVMIEDNAGDVGLFLLAVEEVGLAAQIHPVPDAIGAFSMMDALSVPPRLILLDMHLPLIQGDILLQEIRKSRAWSEVPLIVFTASTSEHDIDRCLSLGAIGFKTKPSSYDGFMEFARTLRPYAHSRRWHSC